MAMVSAETTDDLLGLPEAARRLQLGRTTLNRMVLAGELPARRIGPHWYVERGDLDQFASAYRPSRYQRTKHSAAASREQIAKLLTDWPEATADELAVGVALHPGNIRKHLVILEAEGVAERINDGFWRLTEAGRRRYEGSTPARS